MLSQFKSKKRKKKSSRLFSVLLGTFLASVCHFAPTPPQNWNLHVEPSVPLPSFPRLSVIIVLLTLLNRIFSSQDRKQSAKISMKSIFSLNARLTKITGLKQNILRKKQPRVLGKYLRVKSFFPKLQLSNFFINLSGVTLPISHLKLFCTMPRVAQAHGKEH